MLTPGLDDVRLFLHVLAASVWVGGQLTLAGLLTQFEPTFAIMPGSTPDAAAVPADAFAYRDLGDSSGG